MIDTHAHLDGEEFLEDLPEVMEKIKESGVERVFIPAISLDSCRSVMNFCQKYEGFAYPMLGLHPEEVKENWEEELDGIRKMIDQERGVIAIGEVGLDFYWSREYEKEQLLAFRRQVEWSVETGLPLMIHCRTAQNEMVQILKEYKGKLHGGVFHCFTGNAIEARQLLEFDGFVLGIGGVLTFKKSKLPETLAEAVPLDRIVLETDSPYMAPVPMRGTRNDSSYVRFVRDKLAEIYYVSPEDVEKKTSETALRVLSR